MPERTFHRTDRRAGPSQWGERHIVICNWRDSAHPKAGGAELYCEKVADKLAAAGIRITLLTSRPRGADRTEHVEFGRIVRYGSAHSTYFWALVWLFLHRRDIDAVIDSQNGIPYFSPLVLPARTPILLLIHHVHQEQFKVYFPWPVSSLGRILEKRVSRWVYGRRAVCVVSPSSRASVRAELCFKGPLFVIPCGLEPPATVPPRERTANPSISYIGRLVGHKRVDLLIRAVARIIVTEPCAELHVVGDGDQRTALEALAGEMGLSDHITFHGRVSDEERNRVLQRSWISASASMGEGWGLSVMEAAALGIPTVAFRVPGLSDSIRDGSTGWLVESNEAFGEALAVALEAVTPAGSADEWAAKCRKWANRFRWETTADRLMSVLTTERDRLVQRTYDRRGNTDATTVVEFARSTFDPAIFSRLRRTDQGRFDRDHVRILIGGADEHEAHTAIERAGRGNADVQRFRVARHADLMGWDLNAGDAPGRCLLGHLRARQDRRPLGARGQRRGPPAEPP
jgi:glycosyltransferase involved in cell wall biosynthesis